MSTGEAVLSILILAVPGGILYSIYRRKQWFREHGIFTTGIVVKLVEDDKDDEPLCLYPVVRFLTAQQEWIEARYDGGQYPAAYQVGQTVELLYDPANPKKFIIGVKPFGLLDWLPFAILLAVVLYGICTNI